MGIIIKFKEKMKYNLNEKNGKYLKGLSGVYKIINLKSDDFYIGSSIDLQDRYSSWRKEFNLKRYKHLNWLYNNKLEDFEFEVIELLPPIKDKLWEREQYWVDNLKPTLNKDIKNVKGETKHLKEYKGKNHSKFGKPAANRKPVLQFDLEGNLIKEWEYLREVDKFGMDHRAIGKVLRGNRKTYKKCLWDYKK